MRAVGGGAPVGERGGVGGGRLPCVEARTDGYGVLPRVSAAGP